MAIQKFGENIQKVATQNDYIFIGIYSHILDFDIFEEQESENICEYVELHDYALNKCAKNIVLYFPNAVQVNYSNYLGIDISYCHIMYKIPNENVPVDYKERIEEYQKKITKECDDGNCVEIEYTVVLPQELKLQKS
jgi:hypothetical protein